MYSSQFLSNHNWFDDSTDPFLMFLILQQAILPVCSSEQISKSRGCYWLLAPLAEAEDEFCQRAGNVTGYRQAAVRPATIESVTRGR